MGKASMSAAKAADVLSPPYSKSVWFGAQSGAEGLTFIHISTVRALLASGSAAPVTVTREDTPSNDSALPPPRQPLSIGATSRGTSAATSVPASTTSTDASTPPAPPAPEASTVPPPGPLPELTEDPDAPPRPPPPLPEVLAP